MSRNFACRLRKKQIFRYCAWFLYSFWIACWLHRFLPLSNFDVSIFMINISCIVIFSSIQATLFLHNYSACLAHHHYVQWVLTFPCLKVNLVIILLDSIDDTVHCPICHGISLAIKSRVKRNCSINMAQMKKLVWNSIVKIIDLFQSNFEVMLFPSYVEKQQQFLCRPI